MKLNILTAVALGIALSFTMVAQPERGAKKGDPEKRAEMQTIYLTKKLNLTNEQAAELEKVNNHYAQKMIEARKQMEAEMQKRRAKLEKGKAEKEAAIKAILDKDQIELFEGLSEEREGRMGKFENRRKNKIDSGKGIRK